MSRLKQPQKVYTVSEFGLALRARRKALGYTQEQLATMNDCSVRFIRCLETGKEGVSFGKAMDVAHSIGMDLFVMDRGDLDW